MSQQPPAGGRMTIQLPADLRPLYANFAMITHSASEFVIDLAQVMPQVPRAKVQARVVMTPLNAKLLLRALGENLGKFEALHGTVKIPEGNTLADQLFRPFPADESPEE